MHKEGRRRRDQSKALWPGPTEDFRGAKLAILCGTSLVTLLRDDRPDIPFPGQWDFPGGGREGAETPQDCALRETREETSLVLGADDLIWARPYGTAPGSVWFFVARLPGLRPGALRLGSEGQELRLMEIATFLQHPGAIPMFQNRLADYLGHEGGAEGAGPQRAA
ncbi:NUDIX hydrolase [Profundibacterium mesophilum]|uniref:Nucleoside polyphosphate hydrolase n=1 Tax=Profundibacterium mesophilum KAUST100406-0324 TaxID=1037889 RepID=A0A921NQM4_9RHOB|nr:NUDIX hydrolase [Profundibacterium mesophilum]KAF0675497.1 putative nucleoside polyphosphate hydrolase [Profundibacterium mesophilum KAUST100406-0324]